MAKKKKVITIEPKIDTDTLQTGNTYISNSTKPIS